MDYKQTNDSISLNGTTPIATFFEDDPWGLHFTHNRVTQLIRTWPLEHAISGFFEKFRYTIITSYLMSDDPLFSRETTELEENNLQPFPFESVHLKVNYPSFLSTTFKCHSILRKIRNRHFPWKNLATLIVMSIMHVNVLTYSRVIRSRIRRTQMAVKKFLHLHTTLNGLVAQKMGPFNQIKVILQSLILDFNTEIRCLLPFLHIGLLERYLEVYQIDISCETSQQAKFLRHLNGKSELKPLLLHSEVPEVSASTFFRQLKVIRKVFLCCLMILEESEEAECTELYHRVVERAFGRCIQNAIYKSSSTKLRMVELCFGRLNSRILFVLKQLEMMSGGSKSSELHSQTPSIVNTSDRLSNKIERLSLLEKKRKISLKDLESIEEDLKVVTEWVQRKNEACQNQINRAKARKRFSLNSVVDSSKSSLSFNLLDITEESENTVSYDDNYLNIRPSAFVDAHSTAYGDVVGEEEKMDKEQLTIKLDRIYGGEPEREEEAMKPLVVEGDFLASLENVFR